MSEDDYLNSRNFSLKNKDNNNNQIHEFSFQPQNVQNMQNCKNI